MLYLSKVTPTYGPLPGVEAYVKKPIWYVSGSFVSLNLRYRSSF